LIVRNVFGNGGRVVRNEEGGGLWRWIPRIAESGRGDVELVTSTENSACPWAFRCSLVTSDRKILIVEDERDILELVTHYLEKDGFRVRSATDGLNGLAAARHDRPDLIVLDLMLPGMDGLEICRKLRADSATSLTPIMMLTAKTEETDRIVGLELGA